MTPQQAIAFVKTHGIILESARGSVPNLAETVAGEPISGSWWGHAKSDEIFQLTRHVRDSSDVLVCRLVNGKITYIHSRLWPALFRLANRFHKKQLASIREIHTASGKHKLISNPFPKWVPEEVREAAKRLTDQDAESQFSAILKLSLTIE